MEKANGMSNGWGLSLCLKITSQCFQLQRIHELAAAKLFNIQTAYQEHTHKDYSASYSLSAWCLESLLRMLFGVLFI
jgi:hypothetical protein